MKKTSREEKNIREAVLNIAAPTPPIDEEAALCVRAAWLHYGAGLTQGEVAKRLQVPNLKAHRLIARANRLGLVHVSIDGEIAECVRLEDEIRRRYSVTMCEVAPDLDEEPLPLRTLALAGSRFLRLSLESGEHKTIGFGHGRTLAACVAMLPKVSVSGVRLVSLLGGLTQRYATTPFDVIHRLAERTGAEAYVLPLPFYANTIEDRSVFLEQRGVPQVVQMGVDATLRLIGIGTMEADASLLSTGMVEKEEFEEARRLGGVAEILGHILTKSGTTIGGGLSSRALSMPAEEIGRRKTVAIAGGRTKVEAIKAALASGLIFGLITDERTAKALIA
jgi:DNA-binding transcriptional regulator LsrR (DeoR family)